MQWTECKFTWCLGLLPTSCTLSLVLQKDEVQVQTKILSWATCCKQLCLMLRGPGAFCCSPLAAGGAGWGGQILKEFPHLKRGMPALPRTENTHQCDQHCPCWETGNRFHLVIIWVCWWQLRTASDHPDSLLFAITNVSNHGPPLPHYPHQRDRLPDSELSQMWKNWSSFVVLSLKLG